MFGTKSLTKSVEAMATQVEAAGYSVDASYGEATVKILRVSDWQVMSLLEEEAAVEFIEYAEKLATDAKTDLATALLAEAKSYVDSY